MRHFLQVLRQKLRICRLCTFERTEVFKSLTSDYLKSAKASSTYVSFIFLEISQISGLNMTIKRVYIGAEILQYIVLIESTHDSSSWNKIASF